MATKKKYLGGLKLLLFLLFIMLLGTSSICYASFSDPFTSTEIAQINDYFGTNFSTQQMETAYSKLRQLYPTIDKRNVMFVKPAPYQNDTNRLILLANNGTFGSIEYVYLYQGTYDYYFGQCGSADSISTTTYQYVFTYYRNNQTYANQSYAYDGKFNVAKSSVSIAPSLNGYVLNFPTILTTVPTQAFYYQNPDTLTNIAVASANYIILDDYVPPQEPSGDTSGESGLGNITGPSGEDNGNINLQSIQEGLENINSSINTQGENIVNTLTEVPDLSGETISSGEITSQIDFSLLEENQELSRYSNFWFNFIEGLRSALTSNVRSINFEFRGEFYTIRLDDFTLQLPSSLKFILEKISIVFFVWLIIKWWKIIIDKISSGNIEEVLEMNEEEGIVDLF